jgi:peptide/nickel transport system ATP-binding protein
MKKIMNVVEARGITFKHHGSSVETLGGINLAVASGEIVGLSGRSGTGKSTLADILLGLLKPASGIVIWNSRQLAELGKREMRKERRYYQKIFQDPAASFPPHQKTGKAIGDLIRLYRLPLCRRDLQDTVLKPLGLHEVVLDRYPHQLSGGEMQRLALARIILVQPRFVIADEPTSMLDLSVQAEVVRLLEQLVRKYDWSLLFISHDEDLLHAVCDRGLRLVSDGVSGASLVTTFNRQKREGRRRPMVTSPASQGG